MVLMALRQRPGRERIGTYPLAADARVELSRQGDTLVMFAHPQCPCTRASLAELERIISKSQGTVTPWIVFYKPSHTDDGWERTDLWRTAAAIPGAHVISDPDGAEARHFHVATSGQTLLYDAEGRLLFSGGITAARGHEGDNLGKNRSDRLVEHRGFVVPLNLGIWLPDHSFDRDALRQGC